VDAAPISTRVPDDDGAWTTRLTPVPVHVLAEVFDAEAVVVQLRTGVYYAFDRFSTGVWERLAAGEPLGAVASAAAAGRDDPDAVEREVVLLARLFCDEELMAADGPLPDRDDDRVGHPGVTRYTDMTDLLVLDPIHDIDLDGDGWPVANEELGTAAPPVA